MEKLVVFLRRLIKASFDKHRTSNNQDFYIEKNHLSPRVISFGCCQSVGKQREHNEDFIFSFNLSSGGENVNSVFGLFIVGDGMGGHQFGEVASSTAVQSIANYVLNKYQPFLVSSVKSINESPQEILTKAIQEAHSAVINAAPGSGTTITAALVINNQVTISHVGDSRAYQFLDSGSMELLTRDHTLVKRLEELGEITTTEALTHPQRNVLSRAIGHGDNLEADIFTIQFPQPGFLLLCSDGLWGVVPTETMNKIIYQSGSIQGACNQMVSAANQAGGPDNISVILIQLQG